MNRRHLAIPRAAITLAAAAALLALAGCGTLWPTLTTRTSTSRGEAFACARSQVQTLGYRVTSRDDSDYRLQARSQIPFVTREPRDLRRYDQLTVDALSAGSAEGGTLRVQAGTVTETFTRRGPTIESERASAKVRADAQKLLDACANP
jgi:hypothetical protein